MKKNTSQHQHLNNTATAKITTTTTTKTYKNTAIPSPKKAKEKSINFNITIHRSLFLSCATAFGIERLSTDYDLLAFVSQQFFYEREY